MRVYLSTYLFIYILIFAAVIKQVSDGGQIRATGFLPRLREHWTPCQNTKVSQYKEGVCTKGSASIGSSLLMHRQETDLCYCYKFQPRLCHLCIQLAHSSFVCLLKTAPAHTYVHLCYQAALLTQLCHLGMTLHMPRSVCCQ